jgi:hypothetical protein
MWKYIFGAAVGLAVLIMWSSWRTSKRVFTDAHIAEFVKTLFELKESALKKLDSPDDKEVDGKVTSARLAVSYSINKDNGQFRHHLAISTSGRPTPHAIGDLFVYLAIWSLGLPVDLFRLESSQTSVHHGKVTISKDDQDRFIQVREKIPSPAEIKEALIRYHDHQPQCHLIRV